LKKVKADPAYPSRLVCQRTVSMDRAYWGHMMGDFKFFLSIYEFYWALKLLKQPKLNTYQITIAQDTGESWHFPPSTVLCQPLNSSRNSSRCDRMAGIVEVSPCQCWWIFPLTTGGRNVWSHILLPIELFPPSLDAGQSNIFSQKETRYTSRDSAKQIQVGQQCSFTDSDWSEHEEDKLQSWHRRLESIKCQYHLVSGKKVTCSVLIVCS
jgi:hypothetical protein